MPLLREVDAGADAALARYARIAREEDSYLNDVARQALKVARRDDGDLDTRSLGGEHLAIQRRIVRLWLEALGAPVEVALERIEAVLAAAGEKRGERRIEIGAGWTVLTDGRTASAAPPATSPRTMDSTSQVNEEAQ
jgi:hypothetical protein